MKIGYSIPNNQGVEDPNDLVALAVKAEQFGFDSVWVAEHLFHSSYVAERLGDKPYHEALTVLTAIACATKTVRLGTSVLVLPWHDPARLAKTVATLDQLSGGRVDLGVVRCLCRGLLRLLQHASIWFRVLHQLRRCDWGWRGGELGGGAR